mmetsp:Transcript_3750/g.8051  ORF Transcript_3750/g.8051 Transcript_3750/m.8051 type:complete len:236 (-) Transcript_3750:357-1064(-)
MLVSLCGSRLRFWAMRTMDERACGNSAAFFRAKHADLTEPRSTYGAADASSKRSTSGSRQHCDSSLPCLLIVIAIRQPAERRRTCGSPCAQWCERTGRNSASTSATLPSGVLARFHVACSAETTTFGGNSIGKIIFRNCGTIPDCSAVVTPMSCRSRFARVERALSATGVGAESACVSVGTRSASCSASTTQPSRLVESASNAAPLLSATASSSVPTSSVSGATVSASRTASRPW